MVIVHPIISIVMPLYNKAEQVLEAIASIQAQTIDDWELVVVDDGSTDSGPDQVAALPDLRIRLHRQANAGVAAARNAGVALARADLVAFLDADDLWDQRFLETILALKRDYPQARWYATSYRILDSQGVIRQAVLRGLPPDYGRGLMTRYFTVATASNPPVCSSAMGVDKGAIEGIGGFPAGIASGEDLLTWARLAVRYPLAYDVNPLAVFRISGIERLPADTDEVGEALADMARQQMHIKGLRQYLGLWHRMRAVMFLRLGQRSRARRSAWRAVRAAVNGRNLYILALAVLPGNLGPWVDRFLRQWHRKLGC
ncbi:MAG: glycosyltransferase [Pseudomonadota bacterium]|nr:glycosyltransferase [Pseudomonadota bacterium]